MTEDSYPSSAPDDGQSETVNAPVRDDAPPRRGPQPFVWLVVLAVVVLATSGLLLALAVGVLG